MSEYPPPQSGGNAAVKIVLIVGAVLLVVVVVCSGLTYLVVTTVFRAGEQISKNFGEVVKEAVKEIGDVIPSQTTAQMFLEDLRTGQYDAAYESTTADFQKRMQLAELKALVAKHAFLRAQDEAAGLHPTLVHKGANEHRFEATVPAGDPKWRKVTLVLRKVDEDWKVERLAISGEATPEKEP